VASPTNAGVGVVAQSPRFRPQAPEKGAFVRRHSPCAPLQAGGERSRQAAFLFEGVPQPPPPDLLRRLPSPIICPEVPGQRADNKLSAPSGDGNPPKLAELGLQVLLIMLNKYKLFGGKIFGFVKKKYQKARKK